MSKDVYEKMTEEQRTLIGWIRQHRKQIIVAGISVATLILIILGIRNKEKLEDVFAWLKQVVHAKKLPIGTKDETTESIIQPAAIIEAMPVVNLVEFKPPFPVNEHIRNLAEGQHASLAKIEGAIEKGIELNPGQTWVRQYMKREELGAA